MTCEFTIQPINDSHRPWARQLLAEHWGSATIVTRGKAYRADALPGFIALLHDMPAGLLTYRIYGNECEIISLNSLSEGIGIGTALVNAAKDAAISAGCTRLWLITTNDNLHALHFYRKRGFAIAAIHHNAIEESRKLKPEIPLVGIDGIPLRDEIELEIMLQ